VDAVVTNEPSSEALERTYRTLALARGAHETGRLLTARDVSERLGVCVETVLVWIRAGKLEAIRLPSGQLRIDEDRLDAQLREWATPARGVRTTTADAARNGPYPPTCTDAPAADRGVASLVRTTMSRPTPTPKDEES
jgi:excisionase family DNA binding protein